MNSSNAITIFDTTIRQDEEGRYCLSDLHKASGAREADKPIHWKSLERTKALIDELKKQGKDSYLAPIVSIHGGTSPGTFVCKELVYDYAMWISPAFSLKVIRAFDELVTQKKLIRRERPEALVSLRQAAVEILRTELEMASLLGAPLHIAQIEAVKTVRTETGVELQHLLKYAPAQNNIQLSEQMLEPTELGLRMQPQISARAMNLRLCEMGLQRKAQGGGWEPTPTGAALSAQHAWTERNKSGYNLKWNVQAILGLLVTEK